MKSLLAIVLIVSALNSGCRRHAAATNAKGEQMPDVHSLYLLIDRRDTQFDALTVVMGWRAFTQVRPGRCTQPPTERFAASQLPNEAVALIPGLLEQKGLQPPLPPGGVWFALATPDASTGELQWRYFDHRYASVARCFSDLRAAIKAAGQPVHEIPEWIENKAVRAILAPRWLPHSVCRR